MLQSESSNEIPEFIAPYLNNVTTNYLNTAVFHCHFRTDSQPRVQVSLPERLHSLNILCSKKILTLLNIPYCHNVAEALASRHEIIKPREPRRRSHVHNINKQHVHRAYVAMACRLVERSLLSRHLRDDRRSTSVCFAVTETRHRCSDDPVCGCRRRPATLQSTPRARATRAMAASCCFIEVS